MNVFCSDAAANTMIEPVADDVDDTDGDDELAVVLPAEHEVSSSDAAATAVGRTGRRMARCGMTGSV